MGPCRTLPSSAVFPRGCLLINSSITSDVASSSPALLSPTHLKAAPTLPWSMRRTNTFSCWSFVHFPFSIRFWIVLPSFTKLSRSPSCHFSSRLLRTSTWRADLDRFDGFCRRRAGMIMRRTIAKLSLDDPEVNRVTTLVISSIKSFPDAPLGNRNMFRRHNTISL